MQITLLFYSPKSNKIYINIYGFGLIGLIIIKSIDNVHFDKYN